HRSGHPRDLPSFPTRRSSDLGGERVCTQIGCIDGLQIALEKASPWPAGAYVFAFTLDGAPVRCSGALPLQSCDAGPSLRCDVAEDRKSTRLNSSHVKISYAVF